jgi:signal peptidase I
MEPTLSVGDLLIIWAREHYEVGDVVVYQSGRTPVVHRIIALDEENVTTQGDANNTADEPFGVQLIKGEVITAIPYVGHLIWVLKTPLGTGLTVAAAVLLLELSFRKEKQKKSDDLELIKEEIRRLKEEQESAE